MSVRKTRMTLLSIATFIIFIISGIGSVSNGLIVNAIEEKQEENKIVNIPDENLKKLIKEELYITNDEVTVADMQRIYYLDARGIEINSIEGIEYCTDLTTLYVEGGIADLSPISSLSGIRTLGLYNCKITNLDQLKNLINLEDLECENLELRDYSILGSLTNLEILELNNCNIKDMNFLSDLTKLKDISLNNNYIEEISGIDNLSNIQDLDLSNNEIKDIKPLANIPKHTKIEYGEDEGTIVLYENPVGNETDYASKAIIKNIEGKGYIVNCNEESSKNDMHLMKVNGKRYISGKTYNLSSDNELKLEFTKDIKAGEKSNYFDFYNMNDYVVSCDKNTLTVKVTRNIDTNDEYHLEMSGRNIEGLNYSDIYVTGFDNSKEEVAKIAGDINNDGTIDMNDLSIIANDYNKIKSNSSNWNEDEDCINDGIIDIYDITFISSRL